MMKKLSVSLTAVFMVMPLFAFAAGINSAFNPNMIVPDSVFADTKTFGGHDAIQKFLEQKGSVLAGTSREFLLKLHEPDDALLKERLGDPQPQKGNPRTAAELIWDSAQASGLNPQVILVTLNKEQGLITSSFTESRLQRALNHALGFACPDNGVCDDTLSGFYFQLFGNFDTQDNRYIGAPKSLMKSFTTPLGRGPYVNGEIAQVGDTVTFQNTLGGFEGVLPSQAVKIENLATAALYRYTPHVFNGNYNFWRFFTAWFNYPDRTILKSVESGAYFILVKGEARPLLAFVAKANGLSLKRAVTLSPTELARYQVGETYRPPKNTLATLDGNFFLFIKGIKYPIGKFVIAQKKLSAAKAIAISANEAALFESGVQILPREGTLLQAKKSRTVYLVTNGALKRYTALTLKQHKTRGKIKRISDIELAFYPQAGFVAPIDGTLVRTPTDRSIIYLMKDSVRFGMSASLFFNRGYKLKDVKVMEAAALLSFPLGPHPTPREKTYFTVKETGERFLFKDGVLHGITPEKARKRRIHFKIKFPLEFVRDWPVGAPLR